MRLKIFRKHLKSTYGLNQRTEIHASELIRVNKTKRINILKDYCTEIPKIFDTAKLINVCIKIDEHPGVKIFQLAWKRLLQHYDAYLKQGVIDKGIVIADDTDSIQLMNLMRKLHIYNKTSTNNILEDAFSRSSKHSYFIQTVDVVAHLLYRKEFPKGSLKKFGMENQFIKLRPILFKKASIDDAYGIVRK